MRKTNFDRYLDEQLKDRAFAARFRKAGRVWGRNHRARHRAKPRINKCA